MILSLRRKQISETAMILVLIGLGLSTFAFNVQLAKAEPITWMVDDDGPADFTTIQKAINAASPGDTIFVRNGTYYEHVVVKKSVSLIGESREDTIIDGNYTGSPITIVANGVTVTSFMIQNSNITDLAAGSSSNKGILVDDFCVGWLISENIIRNCALGIRTFWDAKSGIIYGNVVENTSVYGIMIGRYARNCSILNNIVKGSNHCGIHVWGWSENCSVSNNNVSNSFIGIATISCSGIDVFCNNICNCVYGFEGSDSYPPLNRIFHNNFINNTINAIEYDVDVWDDGYPSGGNYWSDYTGVDLYNGPYQNETGSDGIGDTPYTIRNWKNQTSGRDHYPLMRPWPREHDIAAVDVVCNRTWVYQGHSVGINVTISNKGDYHENVTVTLYYNITANKIIGVETINMLITENQTITFIWDTASVEYCHNYTITAVTNIASPDAHPSDNTLTDGKVKVRIMGDINGDGIVDMADVSIIIDAFLAEPWHPRWNPDTDLNQDRIIDLADISTAIDHFLQEFTP
jgi:parallel beta-helix repeat protein